MRLGKDLGESYESLRKVLSQGISPAMAMALIIIVSIAISIALYIVFTNYTSRISSGVSKSGVDFIRVEGLAELPSGGLSIYVSNYGAREARVNTIYFIDPFNNEVLLAYNASVLIRPGEASSIVIPPSALNRIEGGTHRVRIKIVTSSGSVAYLITLSKIRKKAELLALKAIPLPNLGWGSSYWTVFNYKTGEYIFYYNDSSGTIWPPCNGTAPIIKGVNSYNVTHLINAPLAIVVNPTKADRDWIFVWNASKYGRFFRLYLQKIPGKKVIDFLIFWSDIYIPCTHYLWSGSLSAEIIRVTVFSNGTYRIACFHSSGAWSHEFYIRVTSANPLVGTKIFTKPFHGAVENICSCYSHMIYCPGMPTEVCCIESVSTLR